MTLDDLTTIKWLGSILAILTLPFVWVHARQNRTDNAVEKIALSSQSIAESVARMEAHQEHFKKDLEMIKENQLKRRGAHHEI